MAKTTLKPWLKESILVDIESTEPLTKKEGVEVSQAIRDAFSWCLIEEEPEPSLFEIKQVIEKHNPALAAKLTGEVNYH